jgi:hypothetical protein
VKRYVVRLSAEERERLSSGAMASSGGRFNANIRWRFSDHARAVGSRPYPGAELATPSTMDFISLPMRFRLARML